MSAADYRFGGGEAKGWLLFRGLRYPFCIVAESESKRMSRIYHKCHFCDGDVSERNVIVDYRGGEELLTVIKNVPAGVCEICGEKYFKAEVVKAMEKTANSKRKPKEVIEVPIRELKVA